MPSDSAQDVPTYDITVVIYAKNAQDDLAGCVRSAIIQDGLRIQVVIVDDASADDTPSIAARIQAAYPNVVVVSRLLATSPTAAKFDGLVAARGTYTLLLDAQDRLCPGALRFLVNEARAKSADILVPSVALVTSQSPRLSTMAETPDEQRASDDQSSTPNRSQSSGELNPAAAHTSSASSGAEHSRSDGLSASTARPTALPNPLPNRVPRLESPPKAIFGADAIAGSIFITHDITPTIKGRLFTTRLLKRGLAEFGETNLGLGEAEAVMFVLSCLAKNLVGFPELISANLLVPDEEVPMSLGMLAKLCQAREAVSFVAQYLKRVDAWAQRQSVWEGFALRLAEKAVRPFPRAFDPTDWGRAATLLLDKWGAPFISAVLSTLDESEQTLATIAFPLSEKLERGKARPYRIVLCVSAFANPTLVSQTFHALSGRMAEIVVVADEHTRLPEELFSQATLPLGQGTLPRTQALQTIIEDTQADGVVMFAGPPSVTWDLLVARSAGCATGLIANWTTMIEDDDPLTLALSAFLKRVPQVALAQAIALSPTSDGAIWKLLGTRVTNVDGLVAQLTLGNSPANTLNDKLLAIRLIQTYRILLTRVSRNAAEAEVLAHQNDALQLVIAARDTTIAELKRTQALPGVEIEAEQKTSRSFFRQRRPRSS